MNSNEAANNNLELLFGTSLYDEKVKEMPPAKDATEKNGLRVFGVDAALVKVSGQFFLQHPVEAQIALGLVRDVSGILGRLLEGGHSIIAGRIAGAFKRVGRDGLSDDIVKTMKSAGYDFRESDPFSEQQNVSAVLTGAAPIVARLKAIWESQRQAVRDVLPRTPGIPDDKDSYMKFVDGIYKSDAYHSLSMEGYSVTPELIDRVRQGNWDPNGNEQETKNRNALAARGYW
ncbi:hypothetical protein AB7813_05450 [Tardiphaga sp. 20_F10_N6_6]|uniref:hypothetical protein n=1 Tax=Tardiphaga sp. 20_F10_N6_6 TaxID=3240788 RepID=UPI003F8C9F8B